MTFKKIAILAVVPAMLASVAVAHAQEIMTEMQPAGNTLTVASVKIANDGWLVVHAMVDGAPVLPSIIGKVAIKAGTTKNVVIELDDATKAGDTVLTMLHVDAGSVGEYEFPGADVPVVADGGPVVKPMKIN